jgi:hypothetical protein
VFRDNFDIPIRIPGIKDKNNVRPIKFFTSIIPRHHIHLSAALLTDACNFKRKLILLLRCKFIPRSCGLRYGVGW